MPDVIIIGAGIIGSSLAYHLTKSGATVTIVDRAEPATGTTASTFAYINAAMKRPFPYFALNSAGIAEHAALRAELGETPWRITGGRLLWHRDPVIEAELFALASESADWGYGVEWLDRRDIAELEPDLRPDDNIERAIHFPDETAVDAAKLAKQLLSIAIGRGAVLRAGHAVLGLQRIDERISGVTLSNGDQLSANMVINCAGPDADHVAQLARRRLPLGPEIGLIVHATMSGAAIGRIVEASGILIRQSEIATGRLLFQEVRSDAEIVHGKAAQLVAERLLNTIRQILPSGARLTLDRFTIGMRPIPADGVSSAGLVPEIPGYGEIVTHSGVTLGPLLGRLIAAEIAGNAPDSLLAAFRPNRFP